MSACSYVNIICEIFCCRLAPEAAKGIVDAVKAADANVGIPATCKNGSFQHRRGVIYCMIRRRLPPQGFTGVQMAIDIPQLLPNLHRKQRLRCKMGQFGRPRILGSAENSRFCTSPGYPRWHRRPYQHQPMPLAASGANRQQKISQIILTYEHALIYSEVSYMSTCSYERILQ